MKYLIQLSLFLLLLAPSVNAEDSKHSFSSTSNKDKCMHKSFSGRNDCTILSKDDWYLNGLTTDLIVNGWHRTSVKNNSGYFCKYYSQSITFDALKKIIGIGIKDLTYVDKSNKIQVQDKISEQWKSCNVMQEYYKETFAGSIGLKDERLYLEKIGPDAFIETEWLTLYLDILDKNKTIRNETNLKAIIVNKNHQTEANKRAELGKGAETIEIIRNLIRHN